MEVLNFLGLHCNLKKCRLRVGEGTQQTIVTKGIFLIGNGLLKVREMVCLFGGRWKAWESVWSLKASLVKWLLKWGI